MLCMPYTKYMKMLVQGNTNVLLLFWFSGQSFSVFICVRIGNFESNFGMTDVAVMELVVKQNIKKS